MDVHEMELRIQLITSLNEVEQMIGSARWIAKESGCSEYELKDTNGNLFLTPLVCNKAALLHAFTILNTKEQHMFKPSKKVLIVGAAGVAVTASAVLGALAKKGGLK